VRLLLDTHAAIWALISSETLPAHIRELIGHEENEIFVSTVSLWEIAIKFRLRGRRHMPISSAEAMRYFRNAGYALLEVRAEHAIEVESMDLDHSDPFDRLILAQALSEPLRLITKDRRLAAYSDTVISW
jgi:PIN domain nuclease of toxin-antitoxin system